MKPTALKVLGHEYQVRYDPRLLAKTNGQPGEVNFYLNEITLDDSLPESSRGETLLHELLEVLNNRLDLGLGHGLITVLSEVLHQVLRENELQFGPGGDRAA